MVCYTENLLPSSHHPNKVPLEVWTKKRQDILHLHLFGCTAYTKIPKEVSHSKLGNISVKYYLIGYYGHDGYKLYDRNTGTIVCSRDVISDGKVQFHSVLQPISLNPEPDLPFGSIHFAELWTERSVLVQKGSVLVQRTREPETELHLR